MQFRGPGDAILILRYSSSLKVRRHSSHHTIPIMRTNSNRPNAIRLSSDSTNSSNSRCGATPDLESRRSPKVDVMAPLDTIPAEEEILVLSLPNDLQLRVQDDGDRKEEEEAADGPFPIQYPNTSREQSPLSISVSSPGPRKYSKRPSELQSSATITGQKNVTRTKSIGFK